MNQYRKAVRDYLNENKIIPKEPQINFGKIKVLTLSFLSISLLMQIS